MLVKFTDFCTKINADYFLPFPTSVSSPSQRLLTSGSVSNKHVQAAQAIATSCHTARALKGWGGGWWHISEVNVTECQRRSCEKTAKKTTLMCRVC